MPSGRSRFAPFLLAPLAAACLASCPEPSPSPAPAVETPRAAAFVFDAARAWRDLEKQVGFGPRPAGSAALDATRAWLEAELRAAGLAPRREPFRAPTPRGEVDFANIYADLPPRSGDTQAPLLILVSHFDTKRMDFPFVGANDAGSSTATLLELARAISTAGPREIALRFLFVDGEEAVRPQWVDPDNRYGSKHHAAQLKVRGERERTKAVIVLDMCGDRDLRFHRDSYSTAWMTELVFAAARREGLAAHIDGPRDAIADDHLSFLELGIPALDLIDFTYGPDNSWWHTHEDTLDKCSEQSLGLTARIVLAALPDLEARLASKR
ncbi:MAG: M28 family peptidase [Planctomycetes bacterium]|nr:M28 family peptidase [Planctomycetota bacterium]